MWRAKDKKTGKTVAIKTIETKKEDTGSVRKIRDKFECIKRITSRFTL